MLSVCDVNVHSVTLDLEAEMRQRPCEDAYGNVALPFRANLPDFSVVCSWVVVVAMRWRESLPCLRVVFLESKMISSR